MSERQIAMCDFASVSKDSEILLCHFRMGHPNFQYLRQVFPYIFSNNKPSDFQCEICELAKHQRTSFPKSNYKPFTMIPSDLWGLPVFLIVLTQNGLLYLLTIILEFVGFSC